jgi:hypothetical protein
MTDEKIEPLTDDRAYRLRLDGPMEVLSMALHDAGCTKESMLDDELLLEAARLLDSERKARQKAEKLLRRCKTWVPGELQREIATALTTDHEEGK